MNVKTNGLRLLAASLMLAGAGVAPVLANDGSLPNSYYVTDGYDKPIADASDQCISTAAAPENLPARSCGATTPVAEPKKEAKEPVA